MKNKLLKKIVGLLGYRLLNKTTFKNIRSISEITPLNISLILKNLFESYNIKKVIQIGANDGKSFDELNLYIKQYKPESILVEPIKNIFKKLKENYKNCENVKFMNCAISVDNKISDIFKVKEEFTKFYDEHIKAISSFQKIHLINHGVKSNHITNEKVNTTSIKQLILDNNFSSLDLLYLDVEGYDGEIVKDLLIKTNIRPFIIFEFIHINNIFLNDLIKILDRERYKIIQIKENIFCYPENKSLKLNLNIFSN